MKPHQPQPRARCTCKRGAERNKCPQCEGTGWVIDFAAIRAAASALGRRGGSVTGPSKARTSEQARAAVQARWAKARLAKPDLAAEPPP